MIQVIEGKIKQYSLPKTDTLKNGSTVSGYNLLHLSNGRGKIPDMTMASKTYVLTFLTVNGGTTWLGMSGGEF